VLNHRHVFAGACALAVVATSVCVENVWLSFAVEACATIVALMVAELLGCSWAEGQN
jgi:hypothetical protein